MKILFSTGCLFYLPMKEIFTLAREAGFDGCDLVVNARFNRPEYTDVALECAEILPVYSIHAPFVKMAAWGDKTDSLIKTVEIARQLNTEIINFHPPSWFQMEIKFFNWLKKIEDIHSELGRNDICLTIENMPLSGSRLRLAPYIFNYYKDLIEFGVEKNLYFTFDTTHLGTFDTDIVAAFIDFFRTGRLKNIHISDHGQSKSHLFLGRGELPMAKLLSTMMRLGYDDMITLEVSPGELPRTREWLVKMMKYQLSFLRMFLGMN